MKTRVFVFLFYFFFSSLSFAGSGPPADPKDLLRKAEESLKTGERKQADFYAARYLGVCESDPASACPAGDFEPFLKKRKLPPKAFLPGDWDPGFLEWFEKSVRSRWGVEASRVRERERSFEIARNTYQGKYYITVVAYPELEQWYRMKDGLVSKPMILAVGAARPRTTLFFGRILQGFSSSQFSPMALDTQKRTLHALWKPEFYDLDGDAVPEVWLRYNITWGNGFTQVMDIYKIQDERELVLLKRFQGSGQGFARRLPDGTIEVGTGSLKQDGHHVETWEYRSGEFQKTSEKDLPFLLKSPDWKTYYSD